MSTKDILIYTPEQRQQILKNYNRDDVSMAEDVATLRNWLKTQPHLPEIPSDNVIERFFLNNKCSIEKTKKTLDMYYTIRSLIPELFENVNPKLPHMKALASAVFSFPLPKLTKEFDRIFIIKMGEEFENLEHFDGYHYFAHTFNIAEIRINEDNLLGTILVYDLNGNKMGHITKLNPMHIKKAAAVMEKVYSNRLTAIHFFNCSGFIDTLITIAKSVLKPKLAARIHVHKDDETMLDFFPTEIVPKDYGGDELSLKELRDLWNKKLDEYKDRFDLLDTLRVNEKLRPEKLENDDILGFHGNFKSLRVD